MAQLLGRWVYNHVMFMSKVPFHAAPVNSSVEISCDVTHAKLYCWITLMACLKEDCYA